jgi:hypothetical protein
MTATKQDPNKPLTGRTIATIKQAHNVRRSV